MNPGYIQVLRASPADRRDLFLGAARRLGTPEQNIEKDFLVCWTLDALFNGLSAGGPRLLFKGGTSLSKGFGLISRFSEDIDARANRPARRFQILVSFNGRSQRWPFGNSIASEFRASLARSGIKPQEIWLRRHVAALLPHPSVAPTASWYCSEVRSPAPRPAYHCPHVRLFRPLLGRRASRAAHCLLM